MSGAGAVLGLTVDAHVHDDTHLRCRLHPSENRATISLEGNWVMVSVTLYADRPGLVRLRDALNEAITGLDVERAKLAKETAGPHVGA